MSNYYVAASFAVTAAILCWDYLSPRQQLRRVRHAIRLRAKRDAARTSSSSSRA